MINMPMAPGKQSYLSSPLLFPPCVWNHFPEPYVSLCVCVYVCVCVCVCVHVHMHRHTCKWIQRLGKEKETVLKWPNRVLFIEALIKVQRCLGFLWFSLQVWQSSQIQHKIVFKGGGGTSPQQCEQLRNVTLVKAEHMRNTVKETQCQSRPNN